MFVSLKLPPQEIARAALIVIGVAFGCYLLWRVQEVLFLLVLAILLATAIEPLVFRLRRCDFFGRLITHRSRLGLLFAHRHALQGYFDCIQGC